MLAQSGKAVFRGINDLTIETINGVLNNVSMEYEGEIE
jgi:hypothetical protein